MKKLILLFCLVITFNLNGQNLFPVKNYPCDAKMFFVENQIKFTEYPIKDSLISDLLKGINKNQLDKLSGEIDLQIIVDTIGNSCCLSVLNKSNILREDLDLILKLEFIRKWSVPVRENKIVPVSIILKLEFMDESIVIERLGFSFKDRNKKYISLDKQFIDR